MADLFPSHPEQSTAGQTGHTEPAVSAMPRFWQLVYLLLTAAFGFMLLPTLFPHVQLRMPLTLIMLALLLLSLKRWTGALFLFVLQLHAFFSERPRVPDVASISVVWGLIGIGLLLVVSRYRTLQERDRQSVFVSLSTLVSTVRTPRQDEVRLLVANLWLMSWQLLKTALMIVVCGVAAGWLLSSVPLQINSIREAGLQPPGLRLVVLALKLFSIMLVTWIAINEIVWRSLSRSQAGMYIRSTFLNWIHRDFRMVVSRRIKASRVRARTAATAITKTVAQPSDATSEDGQTLE